MSRRLLAYGSRLALIGAARQGGESYECYEDYECYGGGFFLARPTTTEEGVKNVALSHPVGAKARQEGGKKRFFPETGLVFHNAPRYSMGGMEKRTVR